LADKQDSMTFVLAVSGSGGHIVPAVKVAEKLIFLGHSVVLVGDFRGFVPLLEKKGLKCFQLDVRGYSNHSFLTILSFGYKIIGSFFRSLHVLSTVRPDRVVGFGGYGSVPVVCAAFVKRIPTMIHEQNVYPGKATRLLSYFVNTIAISFEETLDYLPAKTVLTGCPSHIPQGPYDKKQILAGLGLEEDIYTVLILGGSQGSQRINNCWLQSVPFLLQRMNYQVIHITGKNNFRFVLTEYRRWNVRVCVLPFYEDMDQIYRVAHLAIARAGAASVTEFLSFQLPAILVPYPFAGGHQMENANVMKKSGLATIIEEEILSKEALAVAVEKARQSPKSDDDPVFSSRQNASERLADEILHFTERT